MRGRLRWRGRIEFIRLIRLDRILRVLGRAIELAEAFVHEYVTTVLDVRRQELTVQHRGHRAPSVASGSRSEHDVLSFMS